MNKSGKILVFAADFFEIKQILQALKRTKNWNFQKINSKKFVFFKAQKNSSEITFCLTGIGKKNATKNTRYSLKKNVFEFDKIFFIGLAGAIDPYLKIGAIVSPNAVFHAQNPTQTINFTNGQSVLATSDFPLLSSQEKSQYHASIVDMETFFSITEILKFTDPATHKNILSKISILKAVSDDLNFRFPENFESNNQIFTTLCSQKNCFAKIFKLIKIILTKPNLSFILANLHIYKNSQKAIKNLTKILMEKLN